MQTTALLSQHHQQDLSHVMAAVLDDISIVEPLTPARKQRLLSGSGYAYAVPDYTPAWEAFKELAYADQVALCQTL